MKRVRYIFPETTNFREERPRICWEHMYGWLDGYGVLFDPVVQGAIGVIPEWENGWNGRTTEGDFFITACQQASKCFAHIGLPRIYVRPEIAEKATERMSEKEQLLTPVGEYCYPSHLPLDYYGAGGGWTVGESAALIKKDKSLAVGFEFFAMLWQWSADWPERRLTVGADLLASMLTELGFASSSAPASGLDGDDVQIDCQAYGLNRLFVGWLLDANGADRSSVHAADAHYVEALKRWRQTDFPGARQRLQAAFSALAVLRKRISPLEVLFLEYPHMGILFEDKGFFELEWPQYSRETMLSYLRNIEDKNYRVSLEAGASCWKNLSRRFPALVKDVSNAWRGNKLELTNGTFSLPYALLSPLALHYWQFAHGGKVFQEVFGKKPDTYQCQENSLTPQMPELLRHFGYTRALHITQVAFYHSLCIPIAGLQDL